MKRTQGTGGKSAPRKTGSSKGRAQARIRFPEAVQELHKADMVEAYRFWSGDTKANPTSSLAQQRSELVEWAADPEHVMNRVDDLGRRLTSVLDLFLGAARYQLAFMDLDGARELAYLSAYDLELSLSVLARRGLLVEGHEDGRGRVGVRTFAIPTDLGDTILRGRRAQRRGIFDTFTLRGHLDRLYDDPARASRTPPSRVRELYKMYANEAAAVARVERLPEGLRNLVEKVIMEFGGILPRAMFDRMETDLPHWNGRRWSKILEESLVGTVQRLDLARYGIHHSGESLIVFNEVALAWLRRVAVPGDPDRPHEEASLGVDLVSNISRFLAYIIDHNVRFTVKGEIFKTTEKRILSDLIPNPGRELERAEVLGFIYRFARSGGLIESTGERTFALTSTGRDWEPQSLEHKLGALFEYVKEETDPGAGEPYHQLRLRRLFLRLVKYMESGVWYDIMYLPFISRNQYLCSLDELAVDEYFAARTGAHGGTSDDLQRVAWGLVRWIRTRLYLLGLVDLGYDTQERPVAMRVTRLGARMFGMEEPQGDRPASGNLVVTPDFEVVLFPGEDDAELTHDLDRFCERERLGHLKHFRISDRSVHRALVEGMGLARMVETLERNARTPVPQNVLYSIRDWAGQAGLLFLGKKGLLRGSDLDTMKRLFSDPGVKPMIRSRLDDFQVQFKNGKSAARLRSLLRDLDYLVELE